MAIISSNIKSESTQMDALNLEINNGDFEKIKQVINSWKFRDYQSLLRFVMSIMLDTKDDYIAIQTERGIERVRPNPVLLEQVTSNDGEDNAGN